MTYRQSKTVGWRPHPRVSSFIKSNDYDECWRKLSSPHLVNGSSLIGVTMYGFPGSGKTMIVGGLVSQYEREHQKTGTLIVQFDCESNEAFARSLNELHVEVDWDNRLGLPTPHKFGPTVEALWRENLFDEYLFIFENLSDADLLGDTISWLSLRNEQERAKCRVICTMKALQTCGVPNVELNGFNMKNAKELFNQDDLSSADPIDDDMLRKLVIYLQGNPMALECARSAYGNRDRSISDWLEHYIVQLKRFAHTRLPSVAEAIKDMVDNVNPDDRDMTRMMLLLLSFLQEMDVTREMLHSCLEMVSLITKTPRQRAPVIDVEEKAAKFMVTLRGRSFAKRLEDKLALHSLVGIVVRQMDDMYPENEKENEDKQLKYCSLTASVLNIVMDRDGRFDCDSTTNTKLQYLAYAAALKTELEELNVQAKGSLANKITYVNLLAAMGYCNVLVHRPEKGLPLIDDAIREMRIILGVSDNASAETIYHACKGWTLDEEFKEHVKASRLYQKLTPADLKVLDIKGSDEKETNRRKHLQPKVLDNLIKIKKALSEEKYLALYLPEVVAELFFSKSVHNKSGQEPDYEAAEIGRGLYTLIQKEHEVLLLRSIQVRRDCILKHALSAATKEDLLERVEQYAKLEEDGQQTAYQYGLCRMAAQDSSNRMRCAQQKLVLYGELYKRSGYSDAEYIDRGTEQMEISLKEAQLQNRPRAISYTYLRYAEFLLLCKRYEAAIVALIRAMRSRREVGAQEYSEHHGEPSPCKSLFVKLNECMELRCHGDSGLQIPEEERGKALCEEARKVTEFNIKDYINGAIGEFPSVNPDMRLDLFRQLQAQL